MIGNAFRGGRYLFPDYDATVFVGELKPGTEEARFFDQEYPAQMLRFMSLSQDFTRRSSYRLPDELKVPAAINPANSQPSLDYVLMRHRKIAAKFELFTQGYFADAARIAFQLIQSMRERRERGIPLRSSSESFSEYFFGTYERLPFRKKMVFRLRSLKAYANHFAYSPRFPVIPMEHLKQAMRESSEKVIAAIEFVPHGFFDDFLSFFVRSNDQIHIELFDQIAAQIAHKSRSNSIDFSSLKEIVKSLVQLLRPAQQKEVIVVKTAVYRLFFDRFYLLCPEFVGGTRQEKSFERVCQQMRWFTPRTMGVPEKMMRPEMLDISFVRLVAQNPLLHRAVQEFDFIAFLTNPIDIIEHVFNALKDIEEFARENSLARRFGQFVSMFDHGKLSTDAEKLSFDDFFPLFCLVFSMAWPTNARAIAEGLSKSVGLVTSSSLDFAKLFFTSVVEYVMTVNLADFERHDEDETDPLGVIRRSSGMT
jgi:hypothetical protein